MKALLEAERAAGAMIRDRDGVCPAWQSRKYARYHAHRYETTLARRVSGYLERAMIRRALCTLRCHRSFHSVLDCPSGAGRFLPVLAEFDVNVIVMDTSAAMLQEACQLHRLFREPLRPVIGSVCQIPLPDDAVDVAFCAHALHHFHEEEAWAKALGELARVAKYGVVVSFFDVLSYRGWRDRREQELGRTRDHHRYLTRTDCERRARTVGLSLLSMSTLARFFSKFTAAAFLIDQRRPAIADNKEMIGNDLSADTESST